MKPFVMPKFSITNRDNQQLLRYFYEVSQIPLITVEEEVELSNQIKKGDKKALDKLVNANLRFVISVAKEFQWSGIPLLDLINEGNIGLIIAAERFDPTRGFKFISYAIYCIRTHINTAIINHSNLVRLPANRFSLHRKIRTIRNQLFMTLEREPTTNEIHKQLITSYPHSNNISKDIIDVYKTLFNTPLSLDSSIHEDAEKTWHESLDIVSSYHQGDIFPVNESIYFKDIRIEISRLLNQAKNKVKSDYMDILKMYYGVDPYTQEHTIATIGDKYGISSKQVRSVLDYTIKRLQKILVK